jgi:4-amino-4-deoxy-L-arabinose transferase-like glycosyltransferase
VPAQVIHSATGNAGGMTSTTSSAPPSSAPAGTAPAAPAGPPAPARSRLGRLLSRRSRLGRLLSGRPGEPRWVRPTLLGLLVGTAVLYLWGLGASGWANAFYSAAAQAGSVSWRAFFFGSSDAANAITVDKPPAALWIMALSVRLFGLNSWSILVPQALQGVASVALLYATVRRWADRRSGIDAAGAAGGAGGAGRGAGDGAVAGGVGGVARGGGYGAVAGLLAGVVLAVTPVAALMFRFDNPDSLLVLLLVAGAYAAVRAVDAAARRAGTAWLAFAGALVGFGFLAKMLQALLVVPALALVYLVAAPVRLRRRLGQLAVAGAALVVAAGWWVAVVALVPAADRPYVGGSQHDSVLELTLGYNGFGRITGSETGSVGPSSWGETGWTRLFNSEMGGQISWLLPAALVLLVALLVMARRAPRTDRTRAGALLWGGWLLVTGLVFSFMKGIIHPYYMVALAPAIAALVALGGTELWRRTRSADHRTAALASVTLGLTVAVTALWSYVLLGRAASWHPWLRIAILVAGLGAGALLALLGQAGATGLHNGQAGPGGRRGPFGRREAGAVASVALLAALAGPFAYSLATAATPHTGAIPSAGPTVVASGMGGGPGGGGGQGGTRPGGAMPGNGMTGTGNTGQRPTDGTMPGGGNQNGGGRGGAGGLLDATTPSSALVKLLGAGHGKYDWVAATVGSNNAAGYQLATGYPVMAIGGFNGTDAYPTLARFEAYVKAGRIHYFISAQTMGGSSGSGAAQRIARWVAQHYTASTVGGVTVYDLTAS